MSELAARRREQPALTPLARNWRNEELSREQHGDPRAQEQDREEEIVGIVRLRIAWREDDQHQDEVEPTERRDDGIWQCLRHRRAYHERRQCESEERKFRGTAEDEEFQGRRQNRRDRGRDEREDGEALWVRTHGTE